MNKPYFYVILWQVENPDKNPLLQGLWKSVSTKYFASYEQAQEYANRFPFALKDCTANIVEIEPHDPQSDYILERKQNR